MFTSTTASRLRDLCLEVQLSIYVRTTSKPCDSTNKSESNSNNGNMNLNLAAIRIIGLIAHKSKVSFRCKVIVYILYIKYF